jgi:hypothetical protein
MALSPSVTAMRCPGSHAFKIGEDFRPEFRPVGLLDPDPQKSRLRSSSTANARYTALLRRLVADLHAQRIEEHDRIHRLERPAATSATTASGDRADQIGETALECILLISLWSRSSLPDLPDLPVKPIKTSLTSPISL